MLESEIIALGDYCETLKTNQSFIILVDQFEKQIVQHMLVTEPHETKKREGIYASYLGLRDFIGHMDAVIDEKRKLTAPPAPSETDAQPDDLD